MNNPAGKDLAEAAPAPGEPQTYDARSKHKGVPLSTLYHREHGRLSRKKKAEGQQYLTVPEEKALETFLKNLCLTLDIQCESSSYLHSPIVSPASVSRQINQSSLRARTGLRPFRSVTQDLNYEE
jgi:hypothetical protein